MTAESQYEFLVALLLAILGLELVARRLRLPPAAAFIAGGIVLALLPGIPSFALDSDLVLVVFLPPLLMNGAFFTIWRDFRANISGILLLALGAVLFTTLVVGLAAKWLVPELPWAVCFTLGAVVSPPDAVAANAVIERLSLPASVSARLQGESLLNDASGLVLFRLASTAALTGTFSLTAAAGAFCLLAAGGVAVGFVVGKVGLLAIRHMRDSELVIVVTLLLAGASYIVGERLGVSGVLATVTTGLLLGWDQHATFTAATRVQGQAFWKILIFLLESLLFILIGLSVRGVLQKLGRSDAAFDLLWPVAGVVGSVVLSRFALLFGSDVARRAARRFGVRLGSEPSVAAATVMSWAGMRGVVTLTAALSLPLDLPGRDFVLVSSFAVIIVTVLIQGTTLATVIGLVGLTDADDGPSEDVSGDQARLRVMEAQCDALARIMRDADMSEPQSTLLRRFKELREIAKDSARHAEEAPASEAETRRLTVAAIDAGRRKVLSLHAAGAIQESVLRRIERELDLQQIIAEL